MISCFNNGEGIVVEKNEENRIVYFIGNNFSFFICSTERLTPIASTGSLVSRSPAVSKKRRVMPSMCSTCSITSRVVPAISETMAFSSFNYALSNVDFPAFGLPAITVRTPSRITFPLSNESISGTIKS